MFAKQQQILVRMQSSSLHKSSILLTSATNSYYNFNQNLRVLLTILILIISSLYQPLVSARSGVSDAYNTRESASSKNSDLANSDNLLDEPQATSGARSAFPMTPFGDPFNIFNLFIGKKDLFVAESDSKKETSDRDKDPELTSRGFYFEQLFGSNDKSNSEKQATSDEPDGARSKWLFSPFSDKQVSDRDGMNNNTIEKAPANPVIMVPGYGGSQLEARLDKPSVVRYFCDHKTDWNDVWINVKLLLPYMIDCLIDNLRLEFDYATNTTRNTVGVEVRVKNASSTYSVEYLNSLQISGFAYFAQIVNQLVESLGYERELDVRGAPYDFRKAPNELGDYFAQLKATSELLFEQNNKRPVSYICHSMGCNNMLYFLQRQPQGWKNLYVRRLISIAAPWGGSLSALRAAAIGDDLGMPYLFSESKLIRVQRSLPSTIYLFPHKQVFSNIPLIRTNVDHPALTSPPSSSSSSSSSSIPPNLTNSTSNTNSTNGARSNKSFERYEKFYQAHDYKSFFDDINHPDGYRMWLNTKDLLGSIDAPNVETWCLVGVGHKTLGRLEYLGEFPHSASLEVYDDGDGTVSLQSASYCKNWSKQQESPVFYKEFNANHMEMLKDEKLLQYISKILDDNNSKR